MGFLLNLSFPADTRHVVAIHDIVVHAVRQAGGDERRARNFAEQAAALIRESAADQSGAGTLTVALEIGPPIRVIVGSHTLTLDPR